MTEFVASAKDGTFAEKGFKGTTYGMSKVGLSALTRIQQQEFDKVTQSLCSQHRYYRVTILVSTNLLLTSNQNVRPSCLGSRQLSVAGNGSPAAGTVGNSSTGGFFTDQNDHPEEITSLINISIMNSLSGSEHGQSISYSSIRARFMLFFFAIHHLNLRETQLVRFLHRKPSIRGKQGDNCGIKVHYCVKAIGRQHNWKQLLIDHDGDLLQRIDDSVGCGADVGGE